MAARSELRRSQGVVPFGVGAVIDFKEESLMSAGLDVWPTEQTSGEMRAALLAACQVLDGRLADRLTIELGRPIRYFLSPAEAQERASVGAAPRIDRAPMPFVRFPNWYFCPRCRILKNVPWNAQSNADVLKCDNLGRRVDGKGEPCGKLYAKRRPALAPVRFVAACANGHIMDFPWSAWAHKDAKRSCSAEDGQLYLYSTPAAGLAGVRVMCTACNVSNSMAGAFRENVLTEIYGAGCPGHRPWLGADAHEICANVPQTIQRGASNAYFAKVVSSILIPPYSAKIRQLLDRPDTWEEIISTTVDGVIPDAFLRRKAKTFGVDGDIFVRAVNERLGAQSPEATLEASGEIRYRYDEYKAYLGPRPPRDERHDFDTDTRDSGDYGGVFGRLFERIVLVSKLRETRVLTGFSRLIPPDALTGQPAQLSRKPKSWLPGFSVRGEGIFLQFRRSAVEDWARTGAVSGRCRTIAERSRQVQHERGLPQKSVSATSLLIHTFSHLLIRQLAFECGYDTSSLRERLYVCDEPETPMAGLLLYTASGDSEGTLGGLVRQGEPERLEGTVRSAVRNAVICSSDPLCIESGGQGLFSLNLSACHACTLLPETSCEESNLLLDRALVVGTPDDPDLGFMSGFLARV
ncbi:DUF1998 domain-containing protein [Mesorhizobium sp. M0684]|uniref:DUF1998 domain-containing protein n=1 Tax=unclassified Mesorhizobium TaxID=325217 RepID=UPI0033351ED9